MNTNSTRIPEKRSAFSGAISRSVQTPGAENGFALLIALSLMAFVFLLLVSMTTLVRIETTSAQKKQQEVIARQNALLGVNIALGQLQKYAGSDQRTTATAGLSNGPSDGTQFWTGVWGNARNPQSDWDSESTHLRWLVSGNETSEFEPNTDISTSADSFGQILTVAGPDKFTPDQAVTGLGNEISPAGNFTISGDAAALLVGNGSAGTLDNASSRFVVAPLVELEGQAGVPGRYAYWVGDEGVKARANLVDPYVTVTSGMQEAGLTAETNSLFRIMLPQRTGIEAMSGFGSFPINDEIIRRVLRPEQIRLVETTITPDSSHARFHDITTDSYGVISDSLKGGLKKDLTYIMAQDESGFNNAMGFTSPTNPLIPTSVMPLAEQGPTWEQLHSFANIDGSVAVEPTPQTATQHGVYPILTQARLTFGGTSIPGSDGYQQFILHIIPVFIIANPYDVPIAASNYNVRLDFAADSHISTYIGREAAPFWRRSLRDFFEGQVFQLRSPILAPGEARIFTLASSPADEEWQAVKTYAFDNDWDAGAARIAVNTATTGGIEIPENVLFVTGSGVAEGNGLGVHIAFGDTNAATPNPSWAGSGGTWEQVRMSSPGNGPARGGTLSWTLSNEDNEVFQRFENIGYSAWACSQYGIRGTGNSSANFSPPAPENRHGSIIFRLADPGNFGVGALAGSNAYPYFSNYNWRAPLISRPQHYANRINQHALLSYTSDFYVASSHFASWIRPDPNNILTNVEWNNVGQGASMANALTTWQPFNIPRGTTGLVSIGQFQHFNAGGHLDSLSYPPPASNLGSNRPATSAQLRPRYVGNTQPIGNSRATPHVARDTYRQLNANEPYYDYSYLLNRVLLDGYFFSTYPQTGSVDLNATRLANSRMTPAGENITLDDPATFRGNGSPSEENTYLAASNLTNAGAFNVNSTSVEAWKALLSSFSDVSFKDENGEAMFPRSAYVAGNSDNADDPLETNAWTGFRNLTPNQIDELATAIVDQIKLRGPSISISDFINRQLTTDDNGLVGLLQAAIEDTSIYENFPANLYDYSQNTVSAIPSAGNNNLFQYPAHLPPHALEGIAGWLTQADLFQSLAPVLTARSDTFRIRAYGESLNEATQDIESRAWCEVVVQRLPDYLSHEDNAITRPADLNDINALFGRRFQVVSFRWLEPHEI